MATFSVKTKLELVLSEFKTDHKSKVYQRALDDIERTENEIGDLFSYALPDSKKQFLIDRGVYISPYGYKSHSHPVSKMIENHILYVVIANQMKNHPDFCTMSLRDAKLRRLKDTGVEIEKSINRVIEVKDALRYAVASNPDSVVLGETIKIKDFEKVAEELGKGKKIMIHDELHHWPKEGFMEFLREVEPELLLVSVVYPVELLKDVNYSCNPGIYEFEVHGDQLIFAPDGVFEEKYSQPADMRWFFAANSFQVGEDKYCSSHLTSIGAHHVFVIKKGDYICEEERMFHSFTAMSLNAFDDMGLKFSPKGIRYEIFMKLLFYIEALQKTNEKNAIAKLRQLDPSCYSKEEYMFIKSFADLHADNGIEEFYETSWIKSFWAKAFEYIPEWIRDYFPHSDRHNLMEMLFKAERFSLCIKCTNSRLLSVEGQFENSKGKPNAPYPTAVYRKSPFNWKGEREIVDRQKILGNTTYRKVMSGNKFSTSHVSLFVLFKGYREPRNQLPPTIYPTPHKILWRMMHFEKRPGFLLMNLLINYRKGPYRLCDISEEERLKMSDEVEMAFQEVKEILDNESIFSDGQMDDTFVEDAKAEEILISLNNAISETVLQRITSERDVDSTLEKEKVLKVEEEEEEEGKEEISNEIEFNECVQSTLERVSFSNEIPMFCETKSEVDAMSEPSSCSSELSGSPNQSGFIPIDLDLLEKAKMMREAKERKLVDVREGFEIFKLHQSTCEAIENSIDFRRSKHLIGRSAVFFSEGFNYGHDSVFYRGVRMPRIIKAVGELFGSFNSCLAQCYNLGARIPFHSDDEDVYGDDPILTINLKGKATFFISDRNGQKKQIRLEEGEAFLMPSGFQKENKHSVISNTFGRISLTYRLQRRDMLGETIKGTNQSVEKEEINLDCLRNSCFFETLCEAVDKEPSLVCQILQEEGNNIHELLEKDEGFTRFECEEILKILKVRLKVWTKGRFAFWGVEKPRMASKEVYLENSHFTCGKRTVIRPTDDRPPNDFARIGESSPLLSKTKFWANSERIKILLSSLDQGTTGKISSFLEGGTERFKIYADSVVQGPRKMSVEEPFFVHTVYGFAGCGKTAPVLKDLCKTSAKAIVVSPRRFLKDMWVEGLKMGGAKRNKIRCYTFETVFKTDFSSLDVLVVDELGLLPPGYLDLILMKTRIDKGGKDCRVILLGDPLQASYYNERDHDILVGEAEFPRDQNTKYAYYTFRNSPWITTYLDVKSFSSHGGPKKMSVTQSLSNSKNILVPSFELKEYYSRRHENSRVMTYGEAQGLTLTDGTIVISNASGKSSLGHVVVALTRFKFAPSLFFHGERDASTFIANSPNGSGFKKILKNQRVDLLKNLETLGFIVVTEPERYGTKEQEDKLVGDPWFLGLIDLSTDVVPDEEEIEFQDFAEPKTTTNLIRAPSNFPYLNANEHNFGLVFRKERFDREAFYMPIGSSLQFVERQNAKPHSSINLNGPSCDNFENIYPRHHSDDSMTFYWAVKKRLRFSQMSTNFSSLENAEIPAEILFRKFEEFVQIDDSRNNALLNECVRECLGVRMKKSAAMFANHSIRTDPDWANNVSKIFMKSQICTKYDNRNIDAKAGQTLACFNHHVLMHFGPWCRYAERKLMMCLPKNFYIHCRKNFNRLNTWVLENFKGGKCVESDYSAFDASQDATILAFEIIFLRKVGWPEHLIEDYKMLKLTMSSKLGNFAVMRFTGEFGTFLFNSIANMAFTFMHYEVPKDAPICFAGDDMCSLVPLEESKSGMKFIEDHLTLKAKVTFPEIPTFCGWCFSKHGIFKQPALILERFLINNERDRIREVIDSYAIEMTYGYMLGDLIYEVMDERQLLAHHCCIRFLLDHKHLMRGISYGLYDWKNLKTEAPKGWYKAEKEDKPKGLVVL